MPEIEAQRAPTAIHDAPAGEKSARALAPFLAFRRAGGEQQG